MPIQLLLEQIFDTGSKWHYNFFDSVSKTTGPHYHDFYELFIIRQGPIIHHTNQKSMVLLDGSLVFTRPGDIHYFEKRGSKDGQFANLAFPFSTVLSLSQFLDKQYLSKILLEPTIPPTIVLNDFEKLQIIRSIESLMVVGKQEHTELLLLLVELIGKFLRRPKSPEQRFPGWLMNVLQEMTKQENFANGLPAMRQISGKSDAYLSRAVKQYTNKTPSEFVNELRLQHAAMLLGETNDEVLDIAFAVGFNSVSHFYQLFKEVYHIAPSQYRKLHHLS